MGFDNMKLGKKVALPKKKKSLEKIEKAVDGIHNESTSKASVILPKSLHRKMKMRIAELDMGVSEYFRMLLEKDLAE